MAIEVSAQFILAMLPSPRCQSASTQAALTIDFLIMGAGVSGLACAIALQRVGHRVVIIEREKEIGESNVRLHYGLIVQRHSLLSLGIVRCSIAAQSVQNLLPLEPEARGVRICSQISANPNLPLYVLH
jgi:glycine/D-amino acid oxidase-like deaminating enzyme